MELSRFLRILRKGLPLIAVLAVVGLGAGALAGLLTPTRYTSATRLFVTLQIFPGSTSGDLVQGNNFAVQKVLSYVDVATSPRVLDPVIDDLSLDTTAAELARDVTATVQPQSVIIELAATAPTADEATALSEAIATSFTDVVVNQLETPVDGSPSPVKVQTLQPATAPSAPSSPQIPLNLGLGLVVGLAAGVVVVLLLGLLDRRLHNRADVTAATGLRVLGTVVRDPGLRRRMLVMRSDPRGTSAEEYRTLRTNLQFVGFEGRARSLVVASATPLEGRTTTAANLAVALAEGGASVAVVDADLRGPTLGRVLGAEQAPGLADVLVGRARLADALVTSGAGLVVLPAGTTPPNPSELLGSTAMADVLGSLTSQFDYVFIDTPPVLPYTDAAVLSRMTSGTLLVVGLHRVKDEELRTAVDSLENAGGSPVGMVLNGVAKRGPDADVTTGAPRRRADVTRRAPRLVDEQDVASPRRAAAGRGAETRRQESRT